MNTSTTTSAAKSSAKPVRTIELPAPAPFLKWAGGKHKLLPQLLPHFPRSFRTYWEPFVGGGAVFFHLSFGSHESYILDLNYKLIETYQVVRDYPGQLIEELGEHQRLALLPDGTLNADYYYDVRSRNGLPSPVQRAAQFIYLNKCCFNGLYRENRAGKFNVPVGKYKNVKICNPEVILSASLGLQRAMIKTANINQLEGLGTFGEEDFVYFDPPYLPVKEEMFSEYTSDEFLWEKHIWLRNLFFRLADKGVKVALSNSDFPEVRKLYEGAKIVEIFAARSINSNGGDRGKISELLVTANCD